MPRPTTKDELISAAEKQWKTMWNLIDAMADEVRQAEFIFSNNSKLKEAHWKRDKVIRDVLIHLYEWHRLLLEWTTANLNGNMKNFLPEPYHWKTYGDMNMEFFNKHQNTSYEDAVKILTKSHNNVMEFIRSLSDRELFEKKYFSWTGSTTLGSYCISVTASHYEWAIKKLKLHIKTCANI